MAEVGRVFTTEEMARIVRDQGHRAAFARLGMPYPDPPTVGSRADDFERWMIQRWLTHLRSDSFRQSAEYQYLRAEWEREF